ncbi:hypothetical protein [Haliscomenobacter hydrossis]|uniref:Uncharacterized protein n=1 Tax=Haliscomenobacter hydrossis (strain ATCC 27775 / DSM 1100 / LMG 10767 / O) TaxID=760192 RepID=F4KYT5_HALH1|nr:hypothetical protein [Haliscomenobacter hydrossis]AEE51477.1 hypothetical protein Halhy_3625 [Haliscomenobacter hydrossis DSM 1100]
MKSIEELNEMLVCEICQYLDEIDFDVDLECYNELTGDVSFLLAGVLESQLKRSFNDWEPNKWIDDSLLTKIAIDGKKVSIWGVMIWGRIDTTQQWIDPFYFEMILNATCSNFVEFTFLFGEEKNIEVTYEEFNTNRNLWGGGFYSDIYWTPFERDWKYIINVKGLH